MEIRDGEKPELLTGDLVTITNRLQDVVQANLRGAEIMVFVFVGERARITKGSMPYLVWPDGTHRTPLFYIPPPNEHQDLDLLDMPGAPEQPPTTRLEDLSEDTAEAADEPGEGDWEGGFEEGDVVATADTPAEYEGVEAEFDDPPLDEP